MLPAYLLSISLLSAGQDDHDLSVMQSAEQIPIRSGSELVENSYYFSFPAILADDGSFCVQRDGHFRRFTLPDGKSIGHNLFQWYILKSDPDRVLVADWSQVAHWPRDYHAIWNESPVVPEDSPFLVHYLAGLFAMRDERFAGALGATEIWKGKVGKDGVTVRPFKTLGFAVIAIVDFEERGRDPNVKGLIRYDGDAYELQPASAAFLSDGSLRGAFLRVRKTRPRKICVSFEIYELWKSGKLKLVYSIPLPRDFTWDWRSYNVDAANAQVVYDLPDPGGKTHVLDCVGRTIAIYDSPPGFVAHIALINGSPVWEIREQSREYPNTYWWNPANFSIAFVVHGRTKVFNGYRLLGYSASRKNALILDLNKNTCILLRFK
ncbi:MAG TPA: hypothetical protein VNK96_08060 [Fimbriimonadales bacterium]|nr:hypothetical protein [Fimbriimonadales bacterium]